LGGVQQERERLVLIHIRVEASPKRLSYSSKNRESRKKGGVASLPYTDHVQAEVREKKLHIESRHKIRPFFHSYFHIIIKGKDKKEEKKTSNEKKATFPSLAKYLCLCLFLCWWVGVVYLWFYNEFSALVLFQKLGSLLLFDRCHCPSTASHRRAFSCLLPLWIWITSRAPATAAATTEAGDWQCDGVSRAHGGIFLGCSIGGPYVIILGFWGWVSWKRTTRQKVPGSRPTFSPVRQPAVNKNV